MRTLLSLILIAAIAYGAWPYYHLYALDRAVRAEEPARLQRLVDIEAVRVGVKARLLGDRAPQAKGAAQGLQGLVQEGLDRLGSEAVRRVVSYEWVREQLAPAGREAGMLHAVSYAFFEGPTEFVFRVGELGTGPVHVQMQLRDWVWRVTAVYP